MTATAEVKTSPKLTIRHSESLEDIHFNLAQDIARAMTTAYSTSSPTSTPPTPQPLLPAAINARAPTHYPLHSQSYLSPPKRPLSAITKPQSPVKIQSRAPVAKPSPAEEELVRRIHRKVGGPSKLSTYDDPAKVRHVVIEALALEQTNASDAARIRRGQLSVFERRVVRTVTNRGAAVRSRMRQRKEVAQLKNELRVRDGRVRYLENMVRALCSKYAVPLPDFLAVPSGEGRVSSSSQIDAETEGESDSLQSTEATRPIPGGIDAPDFALDQELFGNLVDQMITHPAWC